jgi:hypothetical protein
MGPKLLPRSGYEPKYRGEEWSRNARIQATHNCYSYFLDDLRVYPRAGKPQPGLYAMGAGYNNAVTCESVKRRVLADNPMHVITWSLEKAKDKCPKGHYKGFLAVNSWGQDYHFYRQDSDGTWSHKPGGTAVSRTDASRKRIYNPATANRMYGKQGGIDYDKPCTFFCVRKSLKTVSSGNFLTPTSVLKNPRKNLNK